MSESQKLYLMTYDEIFVIHLPSVLYIQADDHYAHVYYSNGTHLLVPYGLSKIEQALANPLFTSHRFCRLGRRYIVNLSQVIRINTSKEQLFMTDDQGKLVSLHLPKAILRQAMDMVKEETEFVFTK